MSIIRFALEKKEKKASLKKQNTERMVSFGALRWYEMTVEISTTRTQGQGPLMIVNITNRLQIR